MREARGVALDLSNDGTPADPRRWPRVVDPPTLEPGEVHLWSTDLDALDTLPRNLPLSPEEHARADAFRFQRDAHRYRVGLWMRRSVLGRYLDMDPDEIRFRTGPYEKPELDTWEVRGSLRFNVSHSSGIAILALTLGSDVGVDIEIPRPATDLVQLARENFHPREWRTVAALESEVDRAAEFYRCWVRKEALVKGVGLGFNLPFDRFAVETAQKKAPALVLTEPELDIESSWVLRDFSAPPDLFAALATKFSPRAILGMSWRP